MRVNSTMGVSPTNPNRSFAMRIEILPHNEGAPINDSEEGFKRRRGLGRA
jgi:hypothetical protein